MNAQAWVALAGLAVTIVILIWKSGRDFGEIKAGLRDLLDRDERREKRMDGFETRLNDHTARIGRLEGRDD